jgi:ankyrin repeat protein
MKRNLVWAAALLAAPVWSAGDRAAEFYRAVHDNDLSALQELVKESDLNVPGKLRFTPLHHAAAMGTPDAARVLIVAGADVKARTQQAQTPLHIAASRPGWAPVVKLLLARGADPHAANVFGGTPLVAAAAYGDVETVRLLLDAGAQVNAADQAGFTPLLGAVGGKNLAVAELLIQRGADVNAATACCDTVRAGQIELGKLTPLMLAAPFGLRDLTRTLLERGAEVEARDVRGMTPLMLAAASETQDTGVVKMLLEKGATSGAHSSLGENAADWARKFNNPAMLALLHAEPAKPDRAPAANRKGAARDAAGQALALLQRSTADYFKQSGCFGCHHQGMTALALGEAQARAWPVDTAAAAETRRSTALLGAGLAPMITQLIDPPPGTDGSSYMLLALGWLKHEPDATTDAHLFYLAARQSLSGELKVGFAARSPFEESDLQRTAIMIHAFRTYAPQARRAEFAERIRRAAAWLHAEPAKTTTDAAMKLLGLAWAGAPAGWRKKAAKELVGRQRSDGGWGGNPYLESDAFSTGQSLYALLAADSVQASAREARRGVRFLLDSQQPDGSWRVRSRAVKFQPYFDGGFPHGHDQWISAAATGWAVMALARADEPPAAISRKDR